MNRIDESFWKKLSSPIGIISIITLTIAAIAAGVIILRYAPAGLINFNNGNIQGWTLDGIYDSNTTNKIQNIIDKPIWVGYTDISAFPNYDNKSDLKGSIVVPVGKGLPKNDKALSGKWQFDFVSPDVSNQSEWQNIKGVEAFITDKFSITGLTPLETQILLDVENSNGLYEQLYEKDGSGKPVIHQTDWKLLWDWNRLLFNIIVPGGYKVHKIRIRVIGIAEGPNQPLSVYSEGYIAIDAISPLK